MAVTGIISEFNPFHRGHVVPIAAARAEMGNHGALVCIMSGNCVQRGDLAIFHKGARAKAAIHGGADLVVELPAPYVLSSAESFARGGVAILAAMGLPGTRLAFGCEDANLEGLIQAARILDAPETQSKIAAGMKTGLSYGKASQAALDAQCPHAQPAEVGFLLKKPNNLLAMAYIRAIHRLGAPIAPLPVPRLGVNHHSLTPEGAYASATYLREQIHRGADGNDSLWDYMPPEAAAIFREELARGRGPASLHRLESAILSLLRHSAPPQEGYLDDSEGLSQRICNMAEKAGTLAELLSLVKTKRYHLSRIRRLIFNICLQMTPSDRPETPPYIKVLAANETGRALIRQMAKSASLPVITRPGQVKTLGAEVNRLFQKERAVTDFLSLCFHRPEERRGGSEWTYRPYLSQS